MQVEELEHIRISETESGGGTKIFDVRAVRSPITTTFSVTHFTDNGNGAITDNFTGLVWQKIQSPDSMTWENALVYCNNLSLAGKTDWRLPNIREIQSLNEVNLVNPSFDINYFPNVLSGTYWSSTTMINMDTIAWDINTYFGIVSYNSKTSQKHVLAVRGGLDNKSLNFTEALIPAGEYEMGDHYGYVDPQHPSDEIPIHNVKIDSMFISINLITNQQYLTFLNSSLLKGSIEVKNNVVYLTGKTDTLCLTYQYFSYYGISYNGKEFSLADFRAFHPMVGISWYGAAVFCNWLSLQNGLQECYNVANWSCDFTKNGYRIPTEANGNSAPEEVIILLIINIRMEILLIQIRQTYLILETLMKVQIRHCILLQLRLDFMTVQLNRNQIITGSAMQRLIKPTMGQMDLDYMICRAMYGRLLMTGTKIIITKPVLLIIPEVLIHCRHLSCLTEDVIVFCGLETGIMVRIQTVLMMVIQGFQTEYRLISSVLLPLKAHGQK